ncbi:NAD(P)-dependent oxidoreductase [Patescibacteria group bacterium]
MRIAIFETEKYEIDPLTKRLNNLNVGFYEEKLTNDILDKVQDYEIISVFFQSKLDAKILKHLPKLKFVATRSTGFDHIDLDYCEKNNIQVSNVPFYGGNSVAEHTFALILALSRKIIESHNRTEKLDFDFHGLTGFKLQGKTIGIVGMGHIGQYVARIANGFEMNIIVYDLNKDQSLAKKLNFKYSKNLDELLEQSDVITLHAPYNKHTHHLINKDNITKIKKGALFINTARGGLVETEALINALNSEIISGAGLDVLEQEDNVKEEAELLKSSFNTSDLRTVIENHMLVARDDVIITPHNAFNTKDAIHKILSVTADNILAYMEGKPINLVQTKAK